MFLVKGTVPMKVMQIFFACSLSCGGYCILCLYTPSWTSCKRGQQQRRCSSLTASSAASAKMQRSHQRSESRRVFILHPC